MQYDAHLSIGNNNLLYWKTTKNFHDGCSAHLRGGVFAGGNVALPDQAHPSPLTPAVQFNTII